MSQDFTPERDASLGLVFRLNFLWSQTDYASLAGDYDKWNNILDCIYRNLLYREEMITEEENGDIVSVKFKDKDIRIYSFLSKQIYVSKMNFLRAKSGKEKSKARSRWFHAIQKKDVWLRKVMQVQKLYLKENKRTPGTAMFGTFGKGRN